MAGMQPTEGLDYSCQLLPHASNACLASELQAAACMRTSSNTVSPLHATIAPTLLAFGDLCRQKALYRARCPSRKCTTSAGCAGINPPTAPTNSTQQDNALLITSVQHTCCFCPCRITLVRLVSLPCLLSSLVWTQLCRRMGAFWPRGSAQNRYWPTPHALA